jgi:hypothetical protein
MNQNACFSTLKTVIGGILKNFRLNSQRGPLGRTFKLTTVLDLEFDLHVFMKFSIIEYSEPK